MRACVSVIAKFHTYRPIPYRKSKLPVAYGPALLSAHSVNISSLLKMPQTNKSRDVTTKDSPGTSGQDQDQGVPVSRDWSQVAGGGDGIEDNVGDSEIIKSPSDPKQYRYSTPYW